MEEPKTGNLLSNYLKEDINSLDVDSGVVKNRLRLQKQDSSSPTNHISSPERDLNSPLINVQSPTISNDLLISPKIKIFDHLNHFNFGKDE